MLLLLLLAESRLDWRPPRSFLRPRTAPSSRGTRGGKRAHRQETAREPWVFLFANVSSLSDDALSFFLSAGVAWGAVEAHLRGERFWAAVRKSKFAGMLAHGSMAEDSHAASPGNFGGAFAAHPHCLRAVPLASAVRERGG